MRTPEEIKKGLECCEAEINECDSCPYREYNWCEEKLKIDVLELLDNLFKDREERDDLAEECQNIEQRLAQVERERDAAVGSLKQIFLPGSVPCDFCAIGCRNEDAWDDIHYACFEWRGVPENTKEETK